MKRWTLWVVGAAMTLASALPAQQGGSTSAGVEATAKTLGSPSAPERAALLAASREIIGAARYATMVTNGLAGQPSARIIDPFAPDNDFTVWIGTVASSRKVLELQKDPRVTLMYFNAPSQEYVTLSGRASFVTDDKARAAHWKDDWNAFYKDQWRGADYVLMRVKVTQLEVLAPRRAINNDPATWKPPTITFP